MKRDFNSFFYKRRNGSTRIGTPMNCPRCGQNFGPNSSYNTVIFIDFIDRIISLIGQ